MAVPTRKWWISTRKQKLWHDLWFCFDIDLDYETLRLFCALGWFGFELRYLADEWWDCLVTSGAALYWKPTHPLTEGCVVFNKQRTIRIVNESTFAREMRMERCRPRP